MRCAHCTTLLRQHPLGWFLCGLMISRVVWPPTAVVPRPAEKNACAVWMPYQNKSHANVGCGEPTFARPPWRHAPRTLGETDPKICPWRLVLADTDTEVFVQTVRVEQESFCPQLYLYNRGDRVGWRGGVVVWNS